MAISCGFTGNFLGNLLPGYRIGQLGGTDGIHFLELAADLGGNPLRLFIVVEFHLDFDVQIDPIHLL